MKMFKWMMMTALVLAGAIYADKPVLKLLIASWPSWTTGNSRWKAFQKHGVNVKLEWFEYGPSMDAFAAKKVDAVGVSNGDATVLNATGAVT